MSRKKDVEAIRQTTRTRCQTRRRRDAVRGQHEKGRLTIRERIAGLVDASSFDEMGAGAGHSSYDEDGNVAGFAPANFVVGLAKIDDRPVAVGGEDFTVGGGSPNEAGLRKSIYAERVGTRLSGAVGALA